jgi:hypothetical protein
MSTTKRKNGKRTSKDSTEVVIVTKTLVPIKDTIFPEKLKRVKDFIKKTNWRPS